MPWYTFKCNRCNLVEKHKVDISIKSMPCEMCRVGVMMRQLPKTAEPDTKEILDKDSGINYLEDQHAIIKARKEDYYWKVEVPRLVATHSVQTCLENGWAWLDDSGGVHIHDKPPARR